MTSLTPTKACVACRLRKTKCDAATAGIPCGGCISRNCADKCTVVARKRRKRPGETVDSSTGAVAAVQSRPHPDTTTGNTPAAAASLAWSEGSSRTRSRPQSQSQSQSQLHYFHILKEAVDDGALDEKDDKTGTPFDPNGSEQQQQQQQQQQRSWHKTAHQQQPDDADREYLTKKGVFDLPPKPCILAFLGIYFATQDPYAPILDKAALARGLDAGTCSLFLLYALLAATSIYAPRGMVGACGFADRAAAQAAFAARATAVYDVQPGSGGGGADDDDTLVLLQGSLLMTKVLPEQPMDRDFNYWFYNALRLATKLQLYSHLNQRTKVDDGHSGLYSRIAWVLYGRHVFHLISEFRNAAYLHGLPVMEAPKVSDWPPEKIPAEYQEAIPRTTAADKALFLATCKLSAIFGEILSTILQEPRVDLARLLRPLDLWRASLASQLQLGAEPPTASIHHLDLLGTSYRYEATVCRLIQRQLRSVDQPRSRAAKTRLRSAMLELDGITGRLLVNGMMDKVTISLMTTVPALLALHLEAALDREEPPLVRGMARVAVGRAMLALDVLREVPAIGKAIPLVELLLSRKGLWDGPRREEEEEERGEEPPPPPLEMQEEEAPPPAGESLDLFLHEFLEDDSLGRWDLGQVDFARLV